MPGRPDTLPSQSPQTWYYIAASASFSAKIGTQLTSRGRHGVRSMQWLVFSTSLHITWNMQQTTRLPTTTVSTLMNTEMLNFTLVLILTHFYSIFQTFLTTVPEDSCHCLVLVVRYFNWVTPFIIICEFILGLLLYKLPSLGQHGPSCIVVSVGATLVRPTWRAYVTPGRVKPAVGL